MARVELDHVTVRIGERTLLDEVSLDVDDGALVTVVGGSGAGKTSILRAVAGLDPVTAGSVRIGGVDVTAAPPAARGVAMVFQMPAFVPRRDVRGNVAFPLELRHQAADEIDRRVLAETRALHIEAILDRRPSTLSAGEAQLVQIARSLVRSPSVLLLDEPLARLDAGHVHHLRRELRALQQGYGVTCLWATNDPAEAMAVADLVVVVDAGRIEQSGPPAEVHARPVSMRAAVTTGAVSVVTMHVVTEGGASWLVHPGGARLRTWSAAVAARVGTDVLVGCRPRGATVLAVDADRDTAPGTVIESAPGTGRVTVALDCGDTSRTDAVEVSVPGGRPPRIGDRVAVRFDEVVVFGPDGRALA
jgi:ABC-type sugar transport system ATPase subunit